MVDRHAQGRGSAAGDAEADGSHDETAGLDFRRDAMKLYHFPSPNPQKVTFALHELGLDCEIVPIDLSKGEQRKPEYLAINPVGRVPVLADGDLTLWDSHVILAFPGVQTCKRW